ncbi:CHAT domain-containing protein [Streptomyces sp. NPDC001984]
MTTAIHERYTKEIYDGLGYFAVWMPNSPVSLGDVGVLRGRRFHRMTSLAELGVAFDTVGPGAPMVHSYSSSGDVEVAVSGEATAPGVLAIAPAAEFGHVPWPAIGIPGSRHDVRFVERCTAVLAPPAVLLAHLADRPHLDDAPPLGLVVIDPGSDLPWVSEDEQLPAARRLLDLVPDGVATVAADADLSLQDFAERLHKTDSDATAVFACHVGPDSRSLDRGILLSPGSAEDPPVIPPRVLTSQMLVDTPDRYPMPRQVLMLACDSGDVGNVSAGEWLVLGPAMLWAGADRLIVTSYPVIDSVEAMEETEPALEGGDVIDERLLSALVLRQPVIDALHDVQRKQLARWRTTGREGAPIHWGGHLAMGAYGSLGTPRSQAPLRRRYVHESVLQFLDDAAGNAARAGRSAITRWDMLVELGLYGFETPNPCAGTPD